MTRKELERLAEKHQKKADTAYQNYQETGITRYSTTYRNNEDLAEAFRMAANAADDHAKLVALKGDLSQLAAAAVRVKYAPEDLKQARMQSVMDDLLALARMHGLIRDDRI